MTLHEIIEKCKSDAVFITAIIILTGVGSFGLGRLSKIESGRQGISIEAPTQVANVVNAEKTTANGKITAKNAENTADISQSSSTISNADDGQARQNFDEQNLGGQVVASKNGTKYHFPWCSGAKTISEANKIYFNSTEEARTAGYTPAANCKGLK